MNVEWIEDSSVAFVRGEVDKCAFVVELDAADWPIQHVHRVRVRQYPDLLEPPGFCIEGSKPGRGAFIVTMWDPSREFEEFYEDEEGSA